MPPSAADTLRQTFIATRVSFRWWGVCRALTKTQKAEAAKASGANPRYLSAGKKLIDTKEPAFAALTEIKTRIEDDWHNCTRPFVERGIRLLRHGSVDDFEKMMAAHAAHLKEKAHEFEAAFDGVRERMRTELAELYNPDDYPPQVAETFGVTWDYPSVSPPDYLRTLNPEVYERECQRVRQRFEEAVAQADDLFAGQLADLIDHLTERLTPSADGTRKVFKDSAVTNLREFVARFRGLSIGNNQQLEHLVSQAEEMLAGLDPEDLRQRRARRYESQARLDERVAAERARLVEGMAAVREGLDALLVTAPRRAWRRADPQPSAENVA